MIERVFHQIFSFNLNFPCEAWNECRIGSVKRVNIHIFEPKLEAIVDCTIVFPAQKPPVKWRHFVRTMAWHILTHKRKMRCNRQILCKEIKHAPRFIYRAWQNKMPDN